jgi:hypothetical protein
MTANTRVRGLRRVSRSEQHQESRNMIDSVNLSVYSFVLLTGFTGIVFIA